MHAESMAGPPRVDIVNGSFFDWDGERILIGGAERYVLALAELIGRLGLCPRILQGSHQAFLRDYQGIEVVGIPSESADFAALSRSFAEATRGAALVIASPVELAVAFPQDVPVVGINHGIHWDYSNNRIDVHDIAHDAARVAAVLATRACVCVDSNFPNWLRCFDAEATRRTRRIPNFVDPARFAPVEKRFDGDLEVLFPRRLCEERGFRITVEAFDHLFERHAGLRLHLCGEGPEGDEAIATAFLGRHPGRVRWSRLAMDEMQGAYAQSHIVLVPTLFAEGTSLSFLEAMATRNAIITTPVGGLPDLVIDAWNALLASPTADGIVAAIEHLLKDRAWLARLATNALTVAPAFSRDRWEARWQTVLHEVIPEAVGGPAAADRAPALAKEGLEQDSIELSKLRSEHDQAQRDLAWTRREMEQARSEHERVRALDQAQHEEADRALQEARAAQRFAEQQHYWSASELAGIKASTGWALLQHLYAIRFAAFPRGSLRERLAKGLMHRARAVLGWWRRHSAVTPESVPGDVPANVPETPKPAAPVALAATPYAVLFLPSIEWAFRRQRPQQMAACFAAAGHPVVFARLTFAKDFAAGPVASGIEEATLPGDPAVNPYRGRMDEVTASHMADALLAHLAARSLGRFVCVVQLPYWAPLAARLRDLCGCDIVYDCMDLHGGFSSNTEDGLADEERLVAEADVVVASSQVLVDQVRSRARRNVLIRNGVEYDAFARVPVAASKPPGRYVIGYYGAIADWFDSALVARIAALRPEWRIELVGSTWSADTVPLEAASNIVLAGEKPYPELPALIADWDCCVIPFLHNPLTDATNPVKVYEMLAAGKPVVSVRLPELEPMARSGLVSIAEGADAFVASIEAAIEADGEPAREARRGFASANTWEQRCAAMRDAIDALTPLVSIIVVTYNNRDLNALCLDSILLDTDWPDIEVIVVDNASTDGTPALLQDVAARDPRVRVVLNADNRGFAAANNQGAELAQGRYLCLLNNDTVVHGGWLSTLVGHLRQHAHLGLVGPVTNAIGNEAKIAVGYTDLAGMPAWADAWTAARSGRLEPIPMLAFFCVVFPREVWRRVGKLDERFGIGMFEDDDYNRRVRAAGFDVRLARDAFVHHWQRASFKLLGEDEYLRIFRENEVRYRHKWTAEAALAPLAAVAAQAPATIVFAPSVGWDIALAQRPHHMARLLARAGYAVVFDCTNAADPVDTLREVEPRLFLYKGPPQLLAGLPRVVVWTFSYNYEYRDFFGADARAVYDWIDDLSVFPYEPRKLAELHARALREADVVASVARRLHDQAREQRGDAIYVPNGVEAGRFGVRSDVDVAAADPTFAALLQRGAPIAGYYGALAHWFDYSLLAAVARQRPDWSFVLIGPDHDGSLARSGVTGLPNVHALGPRRYEDLPGYLRRFDVAMIPFAINDITIATSPLKLFEYFAGGKPVISTPMPECMAFDLVRIVQDAAGFSRALDAARSEGQDVAFVERARELGRQNTWQVRVDTIIAALEGVQPPDARGTAAPGSLVGEETATRPARPPSNPRPYIAPAVPIVESPGQQALMKRFSALETPVNRRYFRALAAHLAGAKDDPCVGMYFEFALSANERGRRAADEIERFQPLAGKRVLDVGCAYGGFLVAMGERGAEPTGFDLDESLLRLAAHNFAAAGRAYPVFRADLTSSADVLPFADRFDVITCNDVIEHVADPVLAIRNVAAMLRTGGVAWFEIPNADAVDFVESDGHYQLFGITQLAPEAARRYFAAHAPGVPYGVGTYLPLDTYRGLMEAAGLQMELLPPSVQSEAAAVRAKLSRLEASFEQKLETVPVAIRDEVRVAVRRYLDGAAAYRGDDASFTTRYGDGFWRIVARKRVAPARIDFAAPPPAAVAH